LATLRQIEQQQLQNWTIDSVVIVSYALVIGLSAQFRVPLVFSPVPITAQTLTVLLAGGLLGPKRGGLAALTYLILGTLGWLPFAGGNLYGPTGGYLVGFVATAYFVGSMNAKGWTKHWWSTLLVLVAGNGLIYIFGLFWLSFYVGSDSVFALGLYPFVIGDLIKIVCALGMWGIFHRNDGFSALML
jgi:biotin transporter BioY